MIAELHKKALKKIERSEDELIGNIFGNLRYIPFTRGLYKILCEAIWPEELASLINGKLPENLDKYIEFWPYDKEGEIDVKIDFPDIVIGIEVKFLSGLSSDDHISYEQIQLREQEQRKNSCQQLARESRMLTGWGKNKEKLLLFLASELDCIKVYKDTINRNILDQNVKFGYITWQNFHTGMSNLTDLSEYEKIIIDDLMRLMENKGLSKLVKFSVDETVLPDLIWKFESDSDFNFLIKHKIEEVGFYEFRG